MKAFFITEQHLRWLLNKQVQPRHNWILECFVWNVAFAVTKKKKKSKIPAFLSSLSFSSCLWSMSINSKCQSWSFCDVAANGRNKWGFIPDIRGEKGSGSFTIDQTAQSIKYWILNMGRQPLKEHADEILVTSCSSQLNGTSWNFLDNYLLKEMYLLSGTELLQYLNHSLEAN